MIVSRSTKGCSLLKECLLRTYITKIGRVQSAGRPGACLIRSLVGSCDLALLQEICQQKVDNRFSRTIPSLCA